MIETDLEPGESMDRHPECHCNSEYYDCGTYTCSMCGRTRPWCLGGDDDIEERYGPTCDECWCVIDRFERQRELERGTGVSPWISNLWSEIG